MRPKHQSLHHFVVDAPWSDETLLAAVRGYVFDRVHRRAGALARQYCGQLGKQDNCQVAVSVSLANEHYSLSAGYRLCLAQEWAEDAERRHKAKVPEEVTFATKLQIAIELLRGLKEAEVLPPLAIANAGYGVNAAFRRDLQALGLPDPLPAAELARGS